MRVGIHKLYACNHGVGLKQKGYNYPTPLPNRVKLQDVKAMVMTSEMEQ